MEKRTNGKILEFRVQVGRGSHLDGPKAPSPSQAVFELEGRLRLALEKQREGRWRHRPIDESTTLHLSLARYDALVDSWFVASEKEHAVFVRAARASEMPLIRTAILSRSSF